MDDPTAETIEALDAELEALYHHDCGHDHEPVAAVDTQHAQAIAQAFNKGHRRVLEIQNRRRGLRALRVIHRQPALGRLE